MSATIETMSSQPFQLVASRRSEDQFSWLRTLLQLPQDIRLHECGRISNVLGPSLPKGTTNTEVAPSKLPKELKDSQIRVLHFSTEEAHTGRLTVFNTSGGSVEFKDVFGSFSTETLIDVFGYGETHTNEAELIIFTPGLNQWHEPRLPTETTAPERLIHYSNILGGKQLLNMNMGTSCDQETLSVDSRFSSFLRTLPSDIAPTRQGDNYVWDPRQFDALQLIISERNLVDNPVKQNYRLIFNAKVAVVLMCYSRATVEVAAALSKYVQDEIDKGRAKSAIEANLYEYITIVTIGNATRTYVDGPRYIHVATSVDPLVASRGVSESSKRGGGRDALFLTCQTTPYAANAFDNHNFGAITAQYLSLILHLNKVSGFRELYDVAKRDSIIEPTHDEVCAMIMLTRGYEWLWSADDAWNNIPHGALPSYDGAWNILRRRCDDSWLQIIDKLSKSPNPESFAANQ